jgi:hypothetical protein
MLSWLIAHAANLGTRHRWNSMYDKSPFQKVDDRPRFAQRPLVALRWISFIPFNGDR